MLNRLHLSADFVRKVLQGEKIRVARNSVNFEMQLGAGDEARGGGL